MYGIVYTFKLPGGRQLLLPGEYFSLGREICCRSVYFAVPGYEIADGDRVLDLGANVGVFSTVAALLGAQVLAVEAQSDLLPLLQGLAKRNEVNGRVDVVHAIVGAKTGVFANVSNRAAASHWRLEPQPTRVSDLLEQRSIQRIDFAKIDIEGSEFALFSHDHSWLRKVEKLVVEVHSRFGNAHELTTLLNSLGFRVRLLDPQMRPVVSLGSLSGYIYASQRRIGVA